MKFKCLIGWHSFEPIAVEHYWDTSYDGRVASTTVVSKCSCCHKLTKQSLYNSGFLTLEQVRGL
jgi:hypothetical protein